ncbi:MAG: MoxR family ATPase [Epsilonproteobacteria bacterium]|nr:MoxR family ATPase [Campylobacterota bacterium]
MTPAAAKRALTHLSDQKVPVFLWGPPGIGKSSIVAQIAKEKAIEFIDLRLSLLDPTDLRGIPFFDAANHQAIWAPASFLPEGTQTKGILFLDELNAAAPMVQASAYQLILDRKIGEYTLPDGWSIVAAGNRESDRGVVYRMPAPLANRFVHLEMEPNIQDWRDWALKSDIESSIISYIGYRPDALFAFDTSKDSHAFATPRSWAYVSQILRSIPDPDIVMPMIMGAIGEELAASYLGFREVADSLPDINDILEGKAVEIPKDHAALHILTTAVVQRTKAHASAQTLAHIVDFSLQLPGEFAIMIERDLKAREIDLQRATNWGKWVRTFSHLTR